MTDCRTIDVLVAGDLIIDRTTTVSVTRRAPEAPCPVATDAATIADERGGAARIADQAAAWGVKVAEIFPSAAGSVKHRIVNRADGSMLCRFDADSCCPYSGEQLKRLSESAARSRVIVLADYDKCAIDRTAARTLIDRARSCGATLIADVKTADAERYRGATIVKGNEAEIKALAGVDTLGADTLAALAATLQANAVIATRGGKGLAAWSRTGGAIDITVPPIDSPAPLGIAGAGDVLTGTLAAMIARGASLATALWNASRIATLKVASASLSCINFAARRDITLTNGCFDVLHAGHLALLERAKAMTGRLVVAVNSDASVRRLKGDDRPVNTLTDRCRMLESMRCVDLVLAFDDDTPLRLIEAITPAVLVKGGDYTPATVVGAGHVINHGGRVEIIPLVPGKSTTSILTRQTNGK